MYNCPLTQSTQNLRRSKNFLVKSSFANSWMHSTKNAEEQCAGIHRILPTWQSFSHFGQMWLIRHWRTGRRHWFHLRSWRVADSTFPGCSGTCRGLGKGWLGDKKSRSFTYASNVARQSDAPKNIFWTIDIGISYALDHSTTAMTASTIAPLPHLSARNEERDIEFATRQLFFGD